MSSVKCAPSIFSVIQNGNSPILDQYDYPELSVKTGIDEGGNVVVLFGQVFVSLYHGIFHWHSLWITSITEADYITISENVYFALDPYFKKNFSEITPPVD